MSNIEETVQSILNMCIDLLARFPKTEYEIAGKINEYIGKMDISKYSEQEIKEIKNLVLTRLKSSGLINDKEYVQSYLRGNNSSIKPDGSLLLFKKLRQKGIPIELLEQVSTQIEEFDKINASKLLTKKFGVSFVPMDLPMTERQKMVSYLAGRGFRYNSISMQGDQDQF